MYSVFTFGNIIVMETLSDKEERCACNLTSCKFRKYRAEDVKAFIKAIKSYNTGDSIVMTVKELDELAGDKLL